MASKFYTNNRQKFTDIIEPKSIAVFFSSDEYPRNGDQNFAFRQNSDLLYLSGIDQEETILVIAPDAKRKVLREILFIKKVSKLDVIWHGKKLSKEDAYSISGIEMVYYVEQFDAVLNELMSEHDNVYLWLNEYPKYQTQVPYKSFREAERLKKKYPLHRYLRAFPILENLRLIKSDFEIDTIKKACQITGVAFEKILKTIKPGIYEFEIEAEITYEFRKNESKSHAYPPIVASGENSCILHYTDNSAECKNGDLLLLDFGAEYNNYASDCSRTIPVNGKFSSRQKECYDAVLRVFKKARTLYIPGNSIDSINQKVNEWINEECVNLGLYTLDESDIKIEVPRFTTYFMHGTSHFIGLDVHDVGQKSTILKKGMILSCEPGLYIEEERIGIRIETDMLVDDVPIDLMAHIPVEVDEIERLMKR